MKTVDGSYVSLDAAVARNSLISLVKPMRLVDALCSQLFYSDQGAFRDPADDALVSVANAFAPGRPFVDGRSAVFRHGDKWLTVQDALLTGVLSQNGVLSVAGQSLPLDVAYELGWLVNCRPPLTLPDAVVLGVYDKKNGLFSFGGSPLTLKEACERGLIDPNEPCVHTTANDGKRISVAFAVQQGVIDAQRGVMTYERLGFDEALRRRLIVRPPTVASLVDVVESDSYDERLNRIAVGVRYRLVPSVLEALDSELITDRYCFAVDWSIGLAFPLRRAVQRGFLDLKKGVIYVDEEGSCLTLREAITHKYLLQLPPPVAFADLVENRLVLRSNDKVLNVIQGCYTPLGEAIADGAVDKNSISVIHPRSGRRLTLDDALRANLMSSGFDQVYDCVRKDHVPLLNAWEEGLLAPPVAPVALFHALKFAFDEQRGSFDFDGRRRPTLFEACRQNLIFADHPAVREEQNGRLFSLQQAFRSGLLDRDNGAYRCRDGDVITLTEAAERRLILDPDLPLTLFELLHSPASQLNSNKITDPLTGRALTLVEAMKVGLLDAKRSSVRLTDGRIARLTDAIDQNIIDLTSEHIADSSGARLTIREARDKRMIMPSSTPISFSTVLAFDLFSEERLKFLHPLTGHWYDLHTALQYGLIDNDASFYHNRAGRQLMSIGDAISKDFISVGRGRVATASGEWLTFPKAIERGLLVTMRPSYSFTEAVRRRFVNLRRLTFTDTRFGLTLPLSEAIRGGYLDCADVRVKDSINESYLPIRSAVRSGQVDLERRVSVDPRSGQWHALILQWENGFVAASRQSITFDRLLRNGHFNLNTGVVVAPLSELRYTMKTAIEANVLDPASALVKNTARRKLVRLNKAIEEGILVQDPPGVIDSQTKERHSFAGALSQGLLLLPEQPIKLVDALEYGLFERERGKFVSPFSASGDMSFGEAKRRGLIDVSGTTIVDPASNERRPLEEALAERLVDAVDGSILDETTGQRHDLQSAYTQGWIEQLMYDVIPEPVLVSRSRR